MHSFRALSHSPRNQNEICDGLQGFQHDGYFCDTTLCFVSPGLDVPGQTRPSAVFFFPELAVGWRAFFLWQGQSLSLRCVGRPWQRAAAADAFATGATCSQRFEICLPLCAPKKHLNPRKMHRAPFARLPRALIHYVMNSIAAALVYSVANNHKDTPGPSVY